MPLTFIKKTLFAAVVAVFAVVPASAGSIFNFTGTCSDCIGTVSATLTLSDNGLSLSPADFVSFTYNGSNLLGAFTINAGDLGLEVSGSIPSLLPGTANVDISNSTFFFESDSGVPVDGNWFAGINNRTGDTGVASTWNAATSTPEPATIGMLAAALMGLVFFRRKLFKSL